MIVFCLFERWYSLVRIKMMSTSAVSVLHEASKRVLKEAAPCR